jgi:hypothetical protein
MKTKKEKKTISALAIERLDATLDAVESDPERFNQGVWVRGTQNGKHAEMCFACFAIDLFGTAKERASLKFDGSYDKLGAQILNIERGITKRLFWGRNTIEEIKVIITELKGEANHDAM